MLKLANGTEIHVEGDHEELEKVLKIFVSDPSRPTEKQAVKKSSVTSTRSKKGPMTYVMSLKERQFFTKQKKSLDDVRKELDVGGHFYKSEDLGVTLLRLVKKGVLRRIKEDKKWLYTSSD